MPAIAKSAQTDVTKMKTYIYRLNFQCLAGSVLEADAFFVAETQLSFGKKHQPAYLSTNISVEILAPPKFPQHKETLAPKTWWRDLKVRWARFCMPVRRPESQK